MTGRFLVCCLQIVAILFEIWILSHTENNGHDKMKWNYHEISNWMTHTIKPLELFTSWSEKFKWLPRIVIHVISTAMCVRVWERAALSILCATCVLNESVHIHGIHNLVCSQRFFEYIYLWNAKFFLARELFILKHSWIRIKSNFHHLISMYYHLIGFFHSFHCYCLYCWFHSVALFSLNSKN